MKVQQWLKNIKFEEYVPQFTAAGYDMPTISRMTPEDLTAIGITKPAHRRKLNAEIQRLNIDDGIPNYRPDTLLEWLTLLRLEEYADLLSAQGYDTIERVIELTWEDMEDVGIKKLGHEKRLMLAIKRIRDLRRHSGAVSSISSSDSASSVSSGSCNGSCPDVARSSMLLASSFYQLSSPTSGAYTEEVAINTQTVGPRGKVSPNGSNSPTGSAATTATPTNGDPSTPVEMKTFQGASDSDQVGKALLAEHQQRQPIYAPGNLNVRSSIDASYLRQNHDQSNYAAYGHNGYGLVGVRQRSLNSVLDVGDDPWLQVKQRLAAMGSGQDIYSRTNGSGSVSSLHHPLDYDDPTSHTHQQHTNHVRFSDNATNGAPPARTGNGTGSPCASILKVKPVAKILAKTREQALDELSLDSLKLKPDSDTNSSSLSLQSSATDTTSNRNGFGPYRTPSGELRLAFDELPAAPSPCHSIYATLKRRKTPPKPPQRTNSMKTGVNGGGHMLSALNGDSGAGALLRNPMQQTLPARCSSLEAMQEQGN